MLQTRNDHRGIRSRRQGRRALPICLAGMLLAGMLLVGRPAAAQGEGQVAVGGELILTVRFPASGMTVKERADAITERLNVILADPQLKPTDIYAVPVGKNGAKIMVKNHLLVTVDSQTARYNQTKPMQLAQMWVTHLRHVLPQLNVKPNPNLGEPVPKTDSSQ